MNVDAEWSIIGELLNNNSSVGEIDLSPDDFANEEFSEIYKAILFLINSGQIANFVTVSAYLDERTGKKWIPTVGGIAKEAGALVGSVKTYAKIIKVESKKRAVKMICAELLNTVDSDVNIVDSAIKDLMLLDNKAGSDVREIGESIRAALEDLEKARDSEGLTGIETGISGLNEITGGYQDSDLIVIAGRPAMGKTAVMLNNVIASDVSAGVFSTEMSHNQAAGRMLAIDSGVNAEGMRLGKLKDDEYPKLTASCARFASRKIFIHDKSAPTIEEIAREARKMKFKYDIQILFIDYIQRLSGDKNLPKHMQVDHICQGLKTIAKELSIPVVALAQVNRKVEERTNRRPMMSDLKDSGAIEQEADLIITLYRDEVYNEDSPDKGSLELNIVKNRHGACRMIRTTWLAKSMQVRDYMPERAYDF